jgi:hypothetical protein
MRLDQRVAEPARHAMALLGLAQAIEVFHVDTVEASVAIQRVLRRLNPLK